MGESRERERERERDEKQLYLYSGVLFFVLLFHGLLTSSLTSLLGCHTQFKMAIIYLTKISNVSELKPNFNSSICV